MELFATDFAAPVGASCTGWTEGLAAAMSAIDFVVFLAHMLIPAALWPARRLLPHGIAPPIALFVLTCGIGHLIDAFTNYVPVYRFAIAWHALTALVSVWAFLVVFARLRGYLRGKTIVPKQELEELRRELRARREKGQA